MLSTIFISIYVTCFFCFVNGEFIMYQNVNRKRGFVINRILPFTMISLVSSEIIENFNLFFVYYRSQGVVYLQA